MLSGVIMPGSISTRPDSSHGWPWPFTPTLRATGPGARGSGDLANFAWEVPCSLHAPRLSPFNLTSKYSFAHDLSVLDHNHWVSFRF